MVKTAKPKYTKLKITVSIALTVGLLILIFSGKFSASDKLLLLVPLLPFIYGCKVFNKYLLSFQKAPIKHHFVRRLELLASGFAICVIFVILGLIYAVDVLHNNANGYEFMLFPALYFLLAGYTFYQYKNKPTAKKLFLMQTLLVALVILVVGTTLMLLMTADTINYINRQEVCC